MKLVTRDFAPEPGTVLVDLSWVMWRSRYAAFNLSVELGGERVPTGHLHGSMMSLLRLATLYKRVVLAVDQDSARKLAYPEYKAHRVKEDATPYEAYRIRRHTQELLGMACAIPHVYFCLEEGLEADDIITAVITRGDNPDVFGADNDLYQNERPYRVFKDIGPHGQEFVDVPGYLADKYKLDGMSHLPIWYKVVRGDPSDNLPPGCPRYPSKALVRLCKELGGSRDWKDFVAYVEAERDLKLDGALPELRRNYDVVCPIPPKAPLRLMRIEDYPVLATMGRYQLLTLANALQFYPGAAIC